MVLPNIGNQSIYDQNETTQKLFESRLAEKVYHWNQIFKKIKKENIYNYWILFCEIFKKIETLPHTYRGTYFYKY